MFKACHYWFELDSESGPNSQTQSGPRNGYGKGAASCFASLYLAKPASTGKDLRLTVRAIKDIIMEAMGGGL